MRAPAYRQPSSVATSLRRLLREPLLHFLLIGAVLVAASRMLESRSAPPPERIVLAAAEVARLTEMHAKVWRQPPSAAELDALIATQVREEAFFREAIKLGLDKDDPVVRRRLVHKMELFGEDAAPVVEPADADLQALLDREPGRFKVASRLSFMQVLIDPRRHGAAVADHAAAILAALEAGRVDPATAGDQTALPPSYDDVTPSEIGAQLGDGLAQALARIEPGQWSGPVRSPYGLHLVKILRRDDGPAPKLPDVRPALRRQWLAEQRQRARDTFYRDLVARYDVQIERPPP